MRAWWSSILLSSLAACSAGRGEPLGHADEALAPGFFIGNVVVDPASYHHVSPAELLTSAEGAGPRTLDVSVSASVSPEISFTGTCTSPTNSQLSTALGYSVTDTIVLTGDSSVLVPVNAYARVDAYPLYQRATWQIIGPGGVVAGSGVALKPIGVWFDTCGCIGPDPCGPGACIAGPPFDAPPAALVTDGGAPDGG